MFRTLIPSTFSLKLKRDRIFCIQSVLSFTCVGALVQFLVHILKGKTSPIEGGGNLERALFVLY